MVPSLLKSVLFDRVGGDVRYQTATKRLVHVASATRLMQLFKVEGLHGTACSKIINNHRHHFYGCGKVIIKKADDSGVSIRGYIVDEYTTAAGTNKLLIYTVGGNEIRINPPQPLGNYNYDLTNTFNYKNIAHKLIEYHPARIVIWKKKPIINLVFHRMVIKTNSLDFDKSLKQKKFKLISQLSS